MIWGTGNPRRELMHVDDLANGVLFLLRLENPPDWVNLGTGVDHSILEIANLVKGIIGFDGEITHDLTKPDGMLVKRLDTSLIKSFGWESMIPFEVGLKSAYEDFLKGLDRGTNRI
jgi:GDP-L-fucose synthase